jgi:hypothetical protein
MVRIKPRPKAPKQCQTFQWYECTDSAFDSLVSLTLGSYLDKVAAGVGPKDKQNRLSSTRQLLAALVAGGPLGLPVSIALKVAATPLIRYPVGHRKALESLLAAGMVELVLRPNENGSMADWENAPNEVMYPIYGPMKRTPGAYRLSVKAWHHLIRNGFDANSLVPTPERMIVVKLGAGDSDNVQDSLVGKPIPPPRHPERSKWYRQLTEYSLSIRRLKFTLRGEALYPSNFDLYRVFNSGDYESGGRFYSSFVQMDSDDRARIHVDGRPLVAMDYKSLHARLAFAIAGLECSDDDLYQLGNHDALDVKAMLLAAISAKSSDGYCVFQRSKTLKTA